MALFASARAKPCNAACSSEARSARSSSPSSLKLIPAGMGVFSVPFGPFTSSSCSWTVTVTPLGTAITFFPIRDMTLVLSIDLRQQLAAYVFAARGFAAHQTFRCRNAIDAVAAQHFRNITRADVYAQAVSRHALAVGYRCGIARYVEKIDAVDGVADI